MNSRNAKLRMIPMCKAWSAGLALALTAFGALAASTDIADVPLASSSTTAVKPNILFTLDDSGSMDDLNMPDDLAGSTGKVSYRSPLCNTIYYNPSTTYIAPPQLADGTKLPNQSFTAAKNNGYDSASTTTTNLSTSFRATGSDTAQAAYYWTLTTGSVTGPLDAKCQGSAPSVPSSTSTTTASANGNTWTKVVVSATSGPGGTDERQNFANWYSYYRSRLMMMKAATARAFVTLSASYRVGFITINPNSPVSSSKYLRISDFDATQKQAFIDKLYSQSTNGFTPLREALSRAGWIYAGQLNTGITNGIPTTDDPVQYSCQQNFTVLTTDGYWNSNGGVKLDGSTIGNTDNAVGAVDPYGFNLPVSPRPMWDSGFDSSTTTTTTTDTYFYSTSGCGGSKKRIRYNETVQQRVQGFSGGTLVSDTTTNSSSTNNNFTSCQNNPPALPTPNPSTTTTTTTNNASSGGSTNSLADVAEYYYKTDLRASMTNNVPSIGTTVEDDRAPWQHMTTFTMGLGIFGTLNFDANYKTNTDPTTDFNKIRSGSLNWPSTDSGSDPTKADDLWHTAVNGRGQAFNAKNPDEVVNGLTTALAGVNARVASAAAAATSNLEPVAGDNFAYTASYETVNWVGELQARQIDLSTGIVETTPIWSAQAKLDGQVNSFCDNRTIYLFRAGGTNNLTPFAWNSDTCDSTGTPVGTPQTTLNASEQANFATANVALLSQFPSMTDGTAGTVNQKAAAAGANLVNFIRGQRGNEGFIANNLNGLYRTRSHILGDIVNAQPLFIRAPFASYTDTGYSNTGGYKEQQASRTPMVYVAANDGMLHAFYAGSSTTDPLGGNERWSFIPSIVLPNLYVLADTNYANLHKFYVDGTPVAGDVYDSAATAWKTIIVAGLNKGGKGYYALDVTDPATPKALWEFKFSSTCYDPANSSTWSADCNLGYTYGNPIISKLSDGTWVVFVTSGYNNVNGDTNDGKGYLYVLNAITGQIIKKIGTNAGDSTTPSGLGKINNWVDNALFDNTTQRVYGADLLGNVWRFDVNGASASGSVAQLMATAKDSLGNPQSIMTKPELALVRGQPFVYVATGRYLGSSDIANLQSQSVYAMRDPLTTTASPTVTPVWTDLRTFAKITITDTTLNGTLSRTAVCSTNCSSTDGWFADLPDSGERVNVDIKLQLGTLTVLSNVPQNSACNIGGFSFINFFDYTSGLPISTAANGAFGYKIADSLAVGMNIVRLPSGKTVAITTTSDSKQNTGDVPIDDPGVAGRRISWREIGE